MVAKHPRTTSSVAEVRKLEAGYDLASLVLAACEERETHDFAGLG